MTFNKPSELRILAEVHHAVRVPPPKWPILCRVGR